MSRRHNKSITLLELVISICILGLLALAFSNLDTFTRYQVMSSDRRAKLQNDTSYVLEHMAKEIIKAIGSTVQDSPKPVVVDKISGDDAIQVWIDYGNPPDGKRDASDDRQIAYRYHRQTGTSPRYEVWYCPRCTSAPCSDCDPQWPTSGGSSDNILSKNIIAFTPTYNPDDPNTNNYIDIEITACWDPAETSFSCGTPDNPKVSLHNRINIPSVSTH